MTDELSRITWEVEAEPFLYAPVQLGQQVGISPLPAGRGGILHRPADGAAAGGGENPRRRKRLGFGKGCGSGSQGCFKKD